MEEDFLQREVPSRRGPWTLREATLLLVLAFVGCGVILSDRSGHYRLTHAGRAMPDHALRNTEAKFGDADSTERTVRSLVSLAKHKSNSSNVSAFEKRAASIAKAPATTLAPTTAPPPAEPTLFCFSLMLPNTPERGLLEKAAQLKAGIFACDDHAIYSSEPGDVWGTQISVLWGVNLWCDKQPTPVEFGGQGPAGMWSAANTRVFKIIWEAIIKDGRWKKHDWIAKTDPDTVFLPWNLKEVLIQPQFVAAQNTTAGGYLQNCPFGLYGGMEVVSSNAVRQMSEHMGSCPYVPQEDVYMKYCFKHMGVPPLVAHWAFCFRGCDIDIQNRMYAEGSPVPKGFCQNHFAECLGHHAAFHALKNPWTWEQCFWRAKSQ